jgi:hypothetical protein
MSQQWKGGSIIECSWKYKKFERNETSTPHTIHIMCELAPVSILRFDAKRNYSPVMIVLSRQSFIENIVSQRFG